MCQACLVPYSKINQSQYLKVQIPYNKPNSMKLFCKSIFFYRLGTYNLKGGWWTDVGIDGLNINGNNFWGGKKLKDFLPKNTKFSDKNSSPAPS